MRARVQGKEPQHMNTSTPEHLSALVLAAGRSRRMGGENKLLLPFRGRTMVEAAVRTIVEAPVAEVVVVTGHERARVERALAGLPVHLVHNPDYHSGMASSLRAGVAAAAPDAAGFLIALGDMPLLRTTTLEALCRAFGAADAPAIVLPVIEGKRGHPVIFDCAFRDELLQIDGDGGARSVLHRHRGAVREVEVEDAGIVRDVDTPAAYDALPAASTGPPGD